MNIELLSWPSNSGQVFDYASLNLLTWAEIPINQVAPQGDFLELESGGHLTLEEGGSLELEN
jgi:hypothetical protein